MTSATGLAARARSARLWSSHLQEQSGELRASNRRVLGECLRVADASLDTTPSRTERQQRLAQRVGRSPAIERAIAWLQTSYDISHSDAFAVLRERSQRQNQKLSLVAEELMSRPRS